MSLLFQPFSAWSGRKTQTEGEKQACLAHWRAGFFFYQHHSLVSVINQVFFDDSSDPFALKRVKCSHMKVVVSSEDVLTHHRPLWTLMGLPQAVWAA